MRECGYLLTWILSYKDRIYDYVRVNNTDQWKPVKDVSFNNAFQKFYLSD